MTFRTITTTDWRNFFKSPKPPNDLKRQIREAMQKRRAQK